MNAGANRAILSCAVVMSPVYDEKKRKESDNHKSRTGKTSKKSLFPCNHTFPSFVKLFCLSAVCFAAFTTNSVKYSSQGIYFKAMLFQHMLPQMSDFITPDMDQPAAFLTFAMVAV